MIYFLQSTEGGPVKIGMTDHLTRRQNQLASQGNVELRVLAVMSGTYPEENALHKKFAHLRVKREWFSPTQELMEFIEREGRKWQGGEERHLTTTKIDRKLAGMARLVATRRGLSLAEFISEILRKPTEQAYAQVMREFEEEKRKGGPKS